MDARSSDFVAGFSAAGVADAYDDVLVPRLFAPCAVVLLARLGLTPGETLLDMACGTGIVGRLAAPVLGPAGRVIGRDLNDTMLQRGRMHPLPPDSAPVELGVAPAAALDLGDASVDAVTCQQGLQFFPDPLAALAEARRVLRPGGRVGVAVWYGIEECPLWAALEVALAEPFGAARAAGIRAPFSWPGAEALTAAMTAGGFDPPLVSTHTMVMHFEQGVRQALRALDATPYAADVAALDAGTQERMAQTAARVLHAPASLDAAVDIPARTLVATALRR
ncbi:MAG TPA: methyltransferase domain-containing protein [Candidatus Dormibacteraeota bacterium]